MKDVWHRRRRDVTLADEQYILHRTRRDRNLCVRENNFVCYYSLVDKQDDHIYRVSADHKALTLCV